MTQAFNLAQLANNLNTSGQLDATDGLSGAVPVANGGTGATSASGAVNNLGAVSINGSTMQGALGLASAYVGTFGSGFGRLAVPNKQIGSMTYSGLYGMSYTYLASISGGNWVSTGGGTAGAINIDEGNFSYSASNGVGSSGAALTWFTRFGIDAAGNQYSSYPGGSSLVNQYVCRAWVNFNGQGTVSIRGSGNVSSVTDNGTGQYTVNFSSALPDANYSVVASCNGTGSSVFAGLRGTPATGSVGIGTIFPGVAYEDHSVVTVAVFR